MGEFDCYCCLCSGPLIGPWEYGSSLPGALQRRRRKVERKRLALAAGEPYDSDDSDPDKYEEEGDDEEDQDIDESEERHLYDPELVTNESTAWIGRLRVLGFNPRAAGSTKLEIPRLTRETRGLPLPGPSYLALQPTTMPYAPTMPSASLSRSPNIRTGPN